MDKPFAAIFSEFQGNPANPEDVQGSGDVKYHLGTSADREFDGKARASVADRQPVASRGGRTRSCSARCAPSRQQRGDVDRDQVMALLLHGDAAFAGQGLVAETLDLSDLKGYRTGGTIHFIVNNQIGFTTDPAQSRSGPYCSDVAKIVQAPIFHVNGDDPEAVVHVARIATEFRQQFKQRRRHRHVLLSPPRPQRGRRAGLHPAADVPHDRASIRRRAQIYAERLVARGRHQPRPTSKQMATQFQARLEEALRGRRRATSRTRPTGWKAPGRGLAIASGDDRRGETAVELETLREVGSAITAVPAGFNAQPQDRAPSSRPSAQMIETGEGIDWATAEALAFGTLLIEGRRCGCRARIAGRGTFSQRHAVLIDQETEDDYVPLNNIRAGPGAVRGDRQPALRGRRARLRVRLHPRRAARAGALGGAVRRFRQRRAGHHRPVHRLGREPSGCACRGLVMLLPHGYEGQGPEHSSARLERYLQLCAEDNMQVVNCTTPGNYLPRAAPPDAPQFPQAADRHDAEIAAAAQALRVASSRTWARARSFHRVLYDDVQALRRRRGASASCCARGKVYYDLFEERAKRGDQGRVHPAPRAALSVPGQGAQGRARRAFRKAEIVWCQEEPKNMGAWTLRGAGHRGRAWPKSAAGRRGRAMSAGRPRRRRRPACCARKDRHSSRTRRLLVDQALVAELDAPG